MLTWQFTLVKTISAAQNVLQDPAKFIKRIILLIIGEFLSCNEAENTLFVAVFAMLKAKASFFSWTLHEEF